MDANVGRIADTSVGWVDPHRWSAVSERAGRQWRIGLRGDIGGFGAGSELAWYVNAFASRRLTDRLALTLGYRVWDFDREGDEDILEFDATLAGGSALTETTRFWFFTVGVVGLLLVFVLKLLRASTRTELIGWSLIVGGARSSNQISIQICFKKAIQQVHSWRLRKTLRKN